MELPDLYRNVAFLLKIDANEALEEFTSKNRWRENAYVIDLGSGDGSTTTYVLEKYLPASYKKIVGCDISKKMVQYADENFKTNRIEFMELDITKHFPRRLQGAFDHAFSSYVLQRIQQQENLSAGTGIAGLVLSGLVYDSAVYTTLVQQSLTSKFRYILATFQNIYHCLKDGGSCFLLFLASHPVYDVFRSLSRNQKWTEDLRNLETFVSPYHDSQDPNHDVTSVMQSVGFKKVEVNVFEKTHTYDNEDVFKNFVKAINPFSTLHDRWDEFMADYFELVPNAIKIDYKLIVAYGLK